MIRIVILALAAVSVHAATDPHLTDSERAKALQLLDDSENEFLSSVSGLSDAQWNFKAAPERWSIAQTAEHIMLSESLIFSAVTGSLQTPVDPDWEAKTGDKAAKIEKTLLDRSGKATAPDALQPKSKLTREEIISRYKTARAKTREFATTTDAALKEHLVPNPFFGPLNGYDWLIYVPLHNMRHDLQIAEVKTAPAYPK